MKFFPIKTSKSWDNSRIKNIPYQSGSSYQTAQISVPYDGWDIY
jgi:hypothetical protein